MNWSLLIQLLGFPATLIHGDTMVLDRWRWLSRRLPQPKPGARLLDVGCGTGIFTTGAARRGYQALGLSWNERDQEVARERALLCGTDQARFELQDIRRLSERPDLQAAFEVVICLEVIEHVIDDRALFLALAGCLKPGGLLLLTTPSLNHREISSKPTGSFPSIEDGSHIRKGYDAVSLGNLCQAAGLGPPEFSWCSGLSSQKITRLKRFFGRRHRELGWFAVLPLRIIPPVCDGFLTPLLHWPWYSMGMEVRKPAK